MSEPDAGRAEDHGAESRATSDVAGGTSSDVASEAASDAPGGATSETAGGATSKTAAGTGPTIGRKRPATIVFAETTLLLEAFIAFFAALVAFGLRVAPAGQVWAAGGVLMVLFVVLSRLQAYRWGRVAGSAAQLALLACGFWVPMMWFVGGVFVVLWVALLVLGARIDRERAAFDATHPGAAEPPRPPRAH